MQRERLLAGGVVAILAVMLLTAALVPDVVAEPRDEHVRSSTLHLQEDDSTIAVAAVPGDTVDLRLDDRLAHRGGSSPNVTVEVRAIDADTGLLVDVEERDVGDLTGDRTVSVETVLTVPREGAYRIETIVYEDGDRALRGERRVSGVGSLTPEYARSSLQFQEFRSVGGAFGPVETRVEQVDGDDVRLNVGAYLLNAGVDPSEEVEVRLRARQAESNLIADDATSTVGPIESGRTTAASVDLTVPDGYNYWIDAFLISDGVVVDTETEAANLLPGQTLGENDTSDEEEFDTGDFERNTTTGAPDDPDGTPDDALSGGEGPGPGLVVALGVLVATALLLARRTTHD